MTSARITFGGGRPGRLALAAALAACIAAGCGNRTRVTGGTTLLDGKPRDTRTSNAGDLASLTGALAHGSIDGRSLPPPATVSSVSEVAGFEAPERPRPAGLAEARARALSDLASSSAHYRYEGALAAGALRIVKAVPLLARIARGPDAAAAPAIGALGVIGGEAAARALAAALARQRATYVRIRIIRALGVTRARRALKPLLRAFADDRALVRIEAARALGNLRDSEAAPRLRAALAEGDTVTAVKVAAASALALLGDAGGMQALERAVSSRSPELGAVAIRGLAAIAAAPGRPGDDGAERARMRAAESIAAALGSPYAVVWGGALRALARLKPPDAVRVLDALGRAAPEVRLRARVAKASFGGTGAREVLEGALTHPAFELRAAAAEILGLLRDRAAVEALSRSLDDPNASVRVAAARALGAIGDPEAAPALKRARARSDAALRRTCAWALGAIGRTGMQAAATAPEGTAPEASPTGGYELRSIVTGAEGKRFCIMREPGGGIVLLGRGEETSAGYRVERIVAGERGGGTVFLSRGKDALTLRAAPAPTTSREKATPRGRAIPER